MTTERDVIEFGRMPSVAPFYLRAVARRGVRLGDEDVSLDITAHVGNVTTQYERVVRYRKLCGFAPDSGLPVTFPHVLAFPLQMAVLTHAHFPFPLPGLIHVSNCITWKQLIAMDEILDLSAFVKGFRETPKGIEFDLCTQAADQDGTMVWEEVSTMLTRRKSKQGSKQGKRKGPTLTGDAALDDEMIWQIPADIGRRYARVAGDWNPIHLSALSARLFGFPRAIATGMWLKARVAAALHAELRAGACGLFVAFKKPVLLPATAVFSRGYSQCQVNFALSSAENGVQYMVGKLMYEDGRHPL